MNEMIESAYLTLQIKFEYQETQRLINLLVFFFSGHLFLNCFIEIQYYYFYFYLQFNYPYFDQILPLFVAIYLFGFFISLDYTLPKLSNDTIFSFSLLNL